MYRILSLDGGGVRGIVPAMVLAELERLAKCRVADMFDLVAATSTGAIVGLALLRPDGNGGPARTATQVAKFYEDTCQEVFHRSLWQRVRSGNGLLGPKHNERQLERRLREEFGETMLTDALTEVLITSYDLKAREPHFFKTRKINEGDQADQPMRVVARATSAAPTYFRPAHLIDKDGQERFLVDGGVTANNPAMCALAHARRSEPNADESPKKKVAMVSIGTGAISIPYDTWWVLHGGVLPWAKPLFDVVLDAQEDAVDYQMKRVLPETRYFRLQADLSEHDDSGRPTKVNEIDNADPRNIAQLKKDAQALIDTSGATLRNIATTFCSTEVRT